MLRKLLRPSLCLSWTRASTNGPDSRSLPACQLRHLQVRHRFPVPDREIEEITNPTVPP